MNFDMKGYILLLAILIMAMGCSRKTTDVINTVEKEKVNADTPTTLPMNPPVRIMDVPKKRASIQPKASVFMMNGDFADNVAVTLGPDGELTYFPAPTDITADSRPVKLAEGWWLNNQGLGQNSVFTNYTFAEYAELPETPSSQQIKNAIIPGSGVTRFEILPFSASSATTHIDEINDYLKNKIK